MRGLTTAVLVVVMITSVYSQEKVTMSGTTFEANNYGKYDIPTYDWYQFEGYEESFYMDGSYPQMLEIIKKTLGGKFQTPTKSFAISETAHHKEWEKITINGQVVDISITKNTYDATIVIYFYDEIGNPDDIIKR